MNHQISPKRRAVVAAAGSLLYALVGIVLLWSSIPGLFVTPDFSGFGAVSVGGPETLIELALPVIASIVANPTLAGWARRSSRIIRALYHAYRWSVPIGFAVFMISVIAATETGRPETFRLLAFSGVFWGAQFVLTAGLLGIYAITRLRGDLEAPEIPEVQGIPGDRRFAAAMAALVFAWGAAGELRAAAFWWHAQDAGSAGLGAVSIGIAPDVLSVVVATVANRLLAKWARTYRSARTLLRAHTWLLIVLSGGVIAETVLMFEQQWSILERGVALLMAVMAVQFVLVAALCATYALQARKPS